MRAFIFNNDLDKNRLQFADSIPNNAIVIMQLEGDEKFNKWSLRLAKSHAENGRPGKWYLCFLNL